MSRILWACFVAIGVGLVAGCGDSKSKVSADEGMKAALDDLGQTLKSLAAEGRKPPTKLAELDSIEPMMATAGPLIRNGDIVYYWGAGHTAEGNQVVAHDKKVPSEGGFVLLQDGSVKEMSASEFQSSPKAKK